MIKVCKWCNENINVEKHIYFAQHVATCKSNPSFEDRKQMYKDLFTGKHKVERFSLIKECPRCKNDFEIFGTYKELYDRDSKKYCSDKCSRARKLSQETKDKISKKVAEYSNSNDPKLKNIFKGKFKTGWYKGYYCDSSWELAFIIYHLENNITFERNKEGFEYIHNGEKHRYYPDFVINNVFYELKGFHTEKVDSKTSYFPYELKILYKKDVDVYLDYVISKYGKDFTSLYDEKTFEEKVNYCLYCGEKCKIQNKYCNKKCFGKSYSKKDLIIK